MKEKKKLIIGISLIFTLLIIAVGITYAAFVYRENTNNQQLVLGDIYMYYNETNQLFIDNMMPTNIEKYSSFDKYVVNPIMQSQTIDNESELAKCVIFLTEGGLPFDEGSDAESYCKGTGTIMNMTFQKAVDDAQNSSDFLENGGQEFLDLGIIVFEEERYIVNPVMSTQNLNELTRCVNYLNNARMPLEDGSTMEEFCQGTGKTVNGYTFQQNIDSVGWFPTEVVTFFKNGNILTTKIENLPYFEFTISGKNEYSEKNIYYEVILNHGDIPDDKLEINRIKDSSLRFRLAKINNDNTETVLFHNKKYGDISNKRIWVETIKANTDYEISNKYRLYMWIDEDITICGGEITDGCDYYSTGETNNWADIFASVKVGVKGDFIEKEIQLEYDELYGVTDEACFETIVVPYYIHNTNMTDEEINKCVTIFEDEWQNDIAEDETWENFCNGTGTRYDKTFQNTLDYSGSFNDEALIYLEENNIIILNGSAVEITAYDSSCGTQVVIPESINGYDKIKIGNRAFGYSNLRNVVFSNNVIAIGQKAFYNGNYLTSVTIPDSVIFLVCDSFASDVIINKNDNLVCTEGLG